MLRISKAAACIYFLACYSYSDIHILYQQIYIISSPTLGWKITIVNLVSALHIPSQLLHNVEISMSIMLSLENLLTTHGFLAIW